jgi:hypothetical protein
VRISHQLSGELVADYDGDQGEDVSALHILDLSVKKANAVARVL